MRSPNQGGRNDAPKDGGRNNDVGCSLRVARGTRRRRPARGEPRRWMRSGTASGNRRRTARRSVRRAGRWPVRWPTHAGSDSTDGSTRRSAWEPVREREPDDGFAERVPARRWRPVRRPVREVTSSALATHRTYVRAKAADPRSAAFAVAFGSVLAVDRPRTRGGGGSSSDARRRLPGPARAPRADRALGSGDVDARVRLVGN